MTVFINDFAVRCDLGEQCSSALASPRLPFLPMALVVMGWAATVEECGVLLLENASVTLLAWWPKFDELRRGVPIEMPPPS